MDNTKLILAVVLVAVAGGVAYFFFRKESTGSSSSPTATTTAAASLTADKADTYQLKVMVDYFKKNVDDGAINWINGGVQEILNGERPLSSVYLVNGQVTKSGAFYDIISSSYFGYGYKIKSGKPEAEVASAMYNMFVNWKTAQELK